MSAELHVMAENFDTMTNDQCLSFIARSRRQLQRFNHLPPAELTKLSSDLDRLERNVLSRLKSGQ